MEIYDRYRLTNEIAGEAGFGYTLHVETGRIEAAIDSHSLDIRNPTTGLGWMSFNVSTNGAGDITTTGPLLFNSNTNEWFVSAQGAGLIGRQGSNYLFSSSGSDNVYFFKGANPHGSDLRLSVGSAAPRALRWNGTNTGDQGWEYQLADGTFHRIQEDLASDFRRTYSIANNTLIGGTAGDYRTLGTLTDTAGSEADTAAIQFDLIFSGGNDQTAQCTRFMGNYGSTHSDWQELLQLHELRRNSARQFAVDTRYNGGQREFRVRRLSTSGLGSFKGVVTVYGACQWITDVRESGSSATVTQVEAGTPLMTGNGRVGINTNNPQAELHVVGNSIVTGAASAAGGFLLKSNSWLAIPRLQEGDVWLGSSNGILHSISLTGGTYTTNRLVP